MIESLLGNMKSMEEWANSRKIHWGAVQVSKETFDTKGKKNPWHTKRENRIVRSMIVKNLVSTEEKKSGDERVNEASANARQNGCKDND